MPLKQVLYAMQFKGRAAPGAAAGSMKVAATGPSCIITTVIGPEGVEGTIQPAPAAGAQFESEVRITGETSFQEKGTIAFGEGEHRLRFSSVQDGYFAPSADPAWKQGCVIWKIEGGDGQFRGATGLITSNFVFSDAGDVSDNQFGVIFVHGAQPSKTEFEDDLSKSTFDEK